MRPHRVIAREGGIYNVARCRAVCRIHGLHDLHFIGEGSVVKIHRLDPNPIIRRTTRDEGQYRASSNPTLAKSAQEWGTHAPIAPALVKSHLNHQVGHPPNGLRVAYLLAVDKSGQPFQIRTQLPHGQAAAKAQNAS
jgi:hypothetical protein